MTDVSGSDEHRAILFQLPSRYPRRERFDMIAIF
jgi:hypothetical protein